jgi:hypothetical protein
MADRWDTNPIFAHTQYRLPCQMSTTHNWTPAKILVRRVFYCFLFIVEKADKTHLAIVANMQLPLAFQLQEAEDRNCSKFALLLSVLSAFYRTWIY